jgi:hypothetical protein
MLLHLTNVSAQVHIGSENPPLPSAMLEVSATNKGILFPAVALASVDDSLAIVNKKPVDGLLVFNTTEAPFRNLYKGLYAWNSTKRLWENIVSDRSFPDILTSHYATEETWFAANFQVLQGDIGTLGSEIINTKSTPNKTLSFKSDDIIVNKKKCFNDTSFTVQENGYYKIICGAEIHVQSEHASDNVEAYLVIDKGSKKTESSHVSVTRSGVTSKIIYTPLTPLLIYNGYLEKGDKVVAHITLKLASTNGNGLGYINRKYLYINIL